MKNGRSRRKATPGNGDGGARRERARRLLNEGAELLRQRRPKDAADQLGLAWQLDPTLIEVAINLGGAYVMQGRYAEAVKVLEDASHIQPDNVMIWINLAAAYLGPLETSDDGGQQRAIVAFEKALSLDPEAPSVNYNLGLIYAQRGETERAAAHFWRALDLDSSDNDARIRLRQLGYEDTKPSDG